MTSPTATLLVRSPRRALRADRLRAALVVAALALVVALAVAAGPRTGAPAPPARTALVVDAAGRPHSGLARARGAGRPRGRRARRRPARGRPTGRRAGPPQRRRGGRRGALLRGAGIPLGRRRGAARPRRG